MFPSSIEPLAFSEHTYVYVLYDTISLQLIFISNRLFILCQPETRYILHKST